MEQKYARGQHPNSRKNLLAQPPAGAQRKGGYAAMKSKKKKKDIREVVEYLLNIPVQKGATKKLKNIMEAREKNLTVVEAMAVAQIKKAVAGDTRAFNALLDATTREPFKTNEVDPERVTTDDILIEELQKRNVQIMIPEDVTFEEDEPAEEEKDQEAKDE